MSRELVKILRGIADIAEDNDKPNWAKAMREAAEYIVADLEKSLPEPVAHQFQDTDGSWHYFINPDHFKNTVEDGRWPIRALYAEPPARKPLSEKEIGEAYLESQDQVLRMQDHQRVILFARAVEKAHGINV
jgi:hypothetical protein